MTAPKRGSCVRKQNIPEHLRKPRRCALFCAYPSTPIQRYVYLLHSTFLEDPSHRPGFRLLYARNLSSIYRFPNRWGVRSSGIMFTRKGDDTLGAGSLGPMNRVEAFMVGWEGRRKPARQATKNSGAGCSGRLRYHYSSFARHHGFDSRAYHFRSCSPGLRSSIRTSCSELGRQARGYGVPPVDTKRFYRKRIHALPNMVHKLPPLPVRVYSQKKENRQVLRETRVQDSVVYTFSPCCHSRAQGLRVTSSNACVYAAAPSARSS